MAYAWLAAPPRRRLAIPPRDLAVGTAVGTGLCVLISLVIASLERTSPAPPAEPLAITIGVAAAEPAAGGGGGGSKGRARQPQPHGSRANAAPVDGVPTPLASTTTTTGKAPSATASTRRIAVPSPFGSQHLPGLDELDEPAGAPGSGDGDGPEGTGDGGTGGGGTGDGGVAAYRSTLASWLSSRFHVESSGLSRKALRKLRVRATLDLGEDRVVIGYDLEPTGTAAIDEGARRALESVKGQQAPAPPPGYGEVQRRIRVTFVCRADTCS